MSEDFSSIKEIVKIVHLALPISFITDEIAGITEILDSWKKQYNNQLEGILVKYSNVSLISRANKIVQDKLCAVVNVKAKFCLFCPNVGDIVKGKIKRISKEHVGCIMHDTINAVIKLVEYCPDELKKFMRMNQDILFEITNFDRRRKEIFVVGKITPHCLELMNDLIPLVPEENASSFSFLNQNVITRYDFDDIEEVSVMNDIKAAEIVNLDTGSEEEVNKIKKRKRYSSESDNSSPKKKKRRKKDGSDKSDQINNISISTANRDLSLDSEKDNLNNGFELSNNYDSASSSVENKIIKSKEENETTNNSLKRSKKKKKKNAKDEKKPKKKNSKKGKIVASGEILKADKKKSHKKKHSNKESKKDKSKDKKRKKSKPKNSKSGDVKIKSVE